MMLVMMMMMLMMMMMMMLVLMLMVMTSMTGCTFDMPFTPLNTKCVIYLLHTFVPRDSVALCRTYHLAECHARED
eukprot:11405750-Karenia_brevis.AAC.1